MTQPKDCTSDLIVKNLVSYKSSQKLVLLRDKDDKNILPNDISALVATLFFMNLRLDAGNGAGVPTSHCAFFLWISMIWMMSLSNAHTTIQHNIVSETMLMIF